MSQVRKKASASASGSVPSWDFEREAAALGAVRTAGVDEAGRGPLAGPVVAAAVVLPIDERIQGLNDSKLLTGPQRDEVFLALLEKATAMAVGVVDAATIDRINILQATRRAMIEAVLVIDPPPDYLLIDGPIRLDTATAQRKKIKGDRLSFSVAAAAIVAKFTRDRIMEDLHFKYPEYGFDRHKGYGTKAHLAALAQWGPCPEHRKTFRGVKEQV